MLRFSGTVNVTPQIKQCITAFCFILHCCP